MKNVLVTGGAGFIGSNFARYLLKKESGLRVINLDLLTYAGLKESLADLDGFDRHIFVHGDICDNNLVGKLMDEYKIDTIVHFAAESHVDRSIECPSGFVQTNVVGTLNLLEAARRFWAGDFSDKRFHHISTDEVYGEISEFSPGCDEFAAYHPRSPYAASKASADHLVRSHFYTYGFPVTVSLCSNNYGPFQFPEKLVPLSVVNALQGKSIPVYGDGHQIRDWVYVLDHCAAIYHILLRGKPGESYNIGGGNQLQNIEVVRKICNILDELTLPDKPCSSLIEHVSDRPGHDRRYALGMNKIEKEIGWLPRYDIDSGLKLTVKWYLENSNWLSIATSRGEYKTWIKKNYHNR